MKVAGEWRFACSGCGELETLCACQRKLAEENKRREADRKAPPPETVEETIAWLLAAEYDDAEADGG